MTQMHCYILYSVPFFVVSSFYRSGGGGGILLEEVDGGCCKNKLCKYFFNLHHYHSSRVSDHYMALRNQRYSKGIHPLVTRQGFRMENPGVMFKIQTE